MTVINATALMGLVGAIGYAGRYQGTGSVIFLITLLSSHLMLHPWYYGGEAVYSAALLATVGSALLVFFLSLNYASWKTYRTNLMLRHRTGSFRSLPLECFLTVLIYHILMEGVLPVMLTVFLVLTTDSYDWWRLLLGDMIIYFTAMIRGFRWYEAVSEDEEEDEIC